MERKLPGLLWIAIVALGIAALAALCSTSHRGLLLPIVTSACDVALLVGLLKGHKWAYILTMLFAFLGTVVAFGKGPTQGLAVLIGNAFVVLPVLLCTSFFFSDADQEQNL